MWSSTPSGQIMQSLLTTKRADGFNDINCARLYFMETSYQSAALLKQHGEVKRHLNHIDLDDGNEGGYHSISYLNFLGSGTPRTFLGNVYTVTATYPTGEYESNLRYPPLDRQGFPLVYFARFGSLDVFLSTDEGLSMFQSQTHVTTLTLKSGRSMQYKLVASIVFRSDHFLTNVMVPNCPRAANADAAHLSSMDQDNSPKRAEYLHVDSLANPTTVSADGGFLHGLVRTKQELDGLIPIYHNRHHCYFNECNSPKLKDDEQVVRWYCDGIHLRTMCRYYFHPECWERFKTTAQAAKFEERARCPFNHLCQGKLNPVRIEAFSPLAVVATVILLYVPEGDASDSEFDLPPDSVAPPQLFDSEKVAQIIRDDFHLIRSQKGGHIPSHFPSYPYNDKSLYHDRRRVHLDLDLDLGEMDPSLLDQIRSGKQPIDDSII